VKNHIFHVEERIYNLQILLIVISSLSGSPLLALSVTFHAQCNSSRVGICAERNSSCAKRDNSRSVQFPLELELCLACFLR